MRQTGTVKWFNATKGYGFILEHSSKKDIFVHSSALAKAGIDTLDDKQQVEFEIVVKNGKESAEHLKLL